MSTRVDLPFVAHMPTLVVYVLAVFERTLRLLISIPFQTLGIEASEEAFRLLLIIFFSFFR